MLSNVTIQAIFQQQQLLICLCCISLLYSSVFLEGLQKQYADHGIHIPTICCFWGQKNTSVVRLDTKCQKEKRYPLFSLSFNLIHYLPDGGYLGFGQRPSVSKKDNKDQYIYIYIQVPKYPVCSFVIVLGHKMCLAQTTNNKKVLYAIKRHSSFVDSLQIVRQSRLLDSICKNKFL